MQPMAEPLFDPRDLRICVGYHLSHADDLALDPETSMEYKHAFLASIHRDLGFEGEASLEPFAHGEPDEDALALRAAFHANGHVGHSALRAFLQARLDAQAGGQAPYRVSERNSTCCMRVSNGWKSCGEFQVVVDGKPLDSRAAVEEYEERRGVLPDPAARDILASTPVVLQVEWTKPLSG